MFLLINRYVLHILTMATFLQICQARSLVIGSSRANTTTGGLLWQPKEGTREEWLACHGMPKDVCERIKVKKEELQKILAKKFDLEDDIEDDSSSKDECIMFTEDQLDLMIAEAKKNEGKTTSTHRRKRTLIDLKKYPYSKWSMPIPYMFDGTHDDTQKAKIRAAIQHWSDNTCIRFRELPTNAVFNSNYILMTKIENDGCYSNLGRVDIIPQQINLEAYCIEAFGTLLHEIGHLLGLVHEQARLGASDSTIVLWSNILANAWSQYMELPFSDALGLPYNYGSVMHYPSKNGFSVNGDDTMIAFQRLYQMNMGQRSDLSFHDRKIINVGYCTGFCTTPLAHPCQRSGYQNPNNCSTCICPGGFSGQYCNEIAQPKNANCGGILNIVSGTQQVIKSPGYDITGYSEYQECTWWIKAPETYTLELEFSGSFSIYCQESACVYHWVEIKYKKDLGLEGARFCCYDRPTDVVISESNEMMIIFRTNYSLGAYSPRGFQAIVKSISHGSSLTSTPITTKITPSSTLTNSSTTSAPITTVSTVRSSTTTKTSTSTKTTPSTTTTATTTSNRPTTFAPSGNGKSLFRCSFEKTTSSADSLCGMTQDTTDQFDWTVYHDPTPSHQTGPDFPFDGNFYIYIEASSPRKYNDEARLFFPKMNFAGDVCVDFYYHMFGFHINTLKLVRTTGSQSIDVWSKIGEIGNIWMHASVGVNISTNSQLQFVGTRGDEDSGDIGLDRIEVKSGQCVI